MKTFGIDSEIIIIVIMSVLLSISTFVSTIGILIDRRKNGIRRITKNGWTLIGINFFYIAIIDFAVLFKQL